MEIKKKKNKSRLTTLAIKNEDFHWMSRFTSGVAMYTKLAHAKK